MNEDPLGSVKNFSLDYYHNILGPFASTAHLGSSQLPLESPMPDRP
jgi:hypothetical protein